MSNRKGDIIPDSKRREAIGAVADIVFIVFSNGEGEYKYECNKTFDEVRSILLGGGIARICYNEQRTGRVEQYIRCLHKTQIWNDSMRLDFNLTSEYGYEDWAHIHWDMYVGIGMVGPE